jgi:hypothetical protein
VKSPFPGLDPYLQRFWPGVHHRLITYTGDLLADKLPENLKVFIEQRIVFETDDSNVFPRLRGYVPDVAVTESKHSFGAHNMKGAAPTTAIAEPLTIRFPRPPISETHIEIRDGATGGRVITTIEFISPSNKMPGPAHDAFVKKQTDLHAGNVSLVEIDLVRGGEWVLTVPEYWIEEPQRTELRISIIRGWEPDVSQFYPITLQQRLPAIPIPLRKTDEPLSLDLQALFELCYERGRYETLIDYASEPLPPLQVQDKIWADHLLRQAGKG